MLVDFPHDQTIPSFIISDITLDTNVTLKNTKIFNIYGNVTSDIFKIENIKVIGSSMSN